MTNPAIKPRRLTWLVIAGIAIAMSACGGGQGNQGMSSAGSSVAPSAPSLLSIAIMPTRTTIAAGATLQFTATGTYSDKSTQTLTNAVTWNSSSTGVATFSSSSNSPGLATAANPGSTSIVASSGTITSPAVTLTVIAAMPAAKSAKRGVAYDLADPSDFAALSPGGQLVVQLEPAAQCASADRICYPVQNGLLSHAMEWEL